MSDRLTPYGIEIETTNETVDKIINGSQDRVGLKEIFGDDTNFDQDSPDAQLVNIFAQAKRDLAELLVQVFDSFDPDQATGTTLDSRVLYNGLFRKGGTYTQVGIDIVCEREVTLQGIDLNETVEDILASNVFTIQDYNGNQYFLLSSQTLPVGKSTLGFRAREMGEVWYKTNTITEIVTPIRGVVSVNNPDSPEIVGANQETDDELKLRRSRAVGLGMLGAVEVLQASLRQISGVVDCAVFENNTNQTLADGTPPHSVWIITRGGNEQAIGQCIYLRLNAGCGMKGSTNVNVKTVFGDDFVATFDKAVEIPLSIKFTVTAKNGVDRFDPEPMKTYIRENYTFIIYQPATSTELDSKLHQYLDNFNYTGIEFSTDPNTRGSAEAEDVTASNFSSVSNGAIRVYLNGGSTAYDVFDLNFAKYDLEDDPITLTDIATEITAGFENAGVDALAEATSDSVILYSKKRGSGSSISVETLPTSVTDLKISSVLDVENGTFVNGTASTAGYVNTQAITQTIFNTLIGVNNGAFNITVDGGTQIPITGIDFTGCADIADIATVISTKLRQNGVLATVTISNLIISITSQSYGRNSAILITSPSSGADITGSQYLGFQSSVSGADGTNGYFKSKALTASVFTTIVNGALAIKVNNYATETISDLNFITCTSLTEVANLINGAMTASGMRCSCSVVDTNKIQITSKVIGSDSKIQFSDVAVEFVDISGIDYLDSETLTYTSGVSPTTWESICQPLSKKDVLTIDESYITITASED